MCHDLHSITFVRSTFGVVAECPCGWRFDGPRANLVHVCAEHLRAADAALRAS
jgi:hypothetical protein